MNASSVLSSVHTLALNTLRNYLKTPDQLSARLHVPRMEGLMRHIPGKTLHVRPELFFQLDGLNRIEFPIERFDLRPDHACLIPRCLPHGEFYSPIRGRFRMLVFFFESDHIEYNVVVSKEPSNARLCMVKTLESERIASALDDLARLSQGADEWNADARQGLCHGILAWLGVAIKAQPANERYSPKIVHALHLISTHLEHAELGTATLARWIGCAPDYLSDLFHKETMTPLIQYVQRERLSKAQYLLNHSPMSIKEIANACGFNDPDYYGRLFRRFTGLTPSRYRAQQARIGSRVDRHLQQ